MGTCCRTFALCSLLLWLVLVPVARGAPLAGRPAPPLVVTDLAGRALDLGALRGHVVVVVLWASWCPGCRAEMKTLDRFAERYGPKGVEVVGLSVDGRHERNAVRKVAADLRFRIAMLADATKSGFEAPAALPMTVVIDRDGIVRAVVPAGRAPITEESLAALVEPLLGTAPASASAGTGPR